MFHARCDQTIADLRHRLDVLVLFCETLEQDKRHLTAQLVEALKPLPQQQVTDAVLQDMSLPTIIDRAIQAVAIGQPALQNQLVGFARQELARGADPSDIAEQILHGDEEIPAGKNADLEFIPPDESGIAADDEIPMAVT